MSSVFDRGVYKAIIVVPSVGSDAAHPQAVFFVERAGAYAVTFARRKMKRSLHIAKIVDKGESDLVFAVTKKIADICGVRLPHELRYFLSVYLSLHNVDAAFYKI